MQGNVWFFGIVMLIVIVQRLLELRYAAANARRLTAMGGYEVGASHYRFFLILHTLFFISLIAEASWRGFALPTWWPIPFTVFAAAQAARVWCIRSLGVYWNTRIFVMPAMKLVKKGPYRFLKHPNYATVTLELAALPLVFHAFDTALWAAICNYALLRYRIRVEEAALTEAATQQSQRQESGNHVDTALS